MISYTLILLLIIISAISKSIMDILIFKFDESIFSKFKSRNWFNPTESWKNKYKDRDVDKGELFFGSTTFLVWVTDVTK